MDDADPDGKGELVTATAGDEDGVPSAIAGKLREKDAQFDRLVSSRTLSRLTVTNINYVHS